MDWTFATWNVRTMLQPGKMAEVADQVLKFNIDAVALQEIRWGGNGRVDKKDYSLFYSGSEKTGMRGTGFMLTKNCRRTLLVFEPISDRLCKIRLKGRFRNVTLISAYAPTESSDEDEKLSFYNLLERTLLAIPKYDVKIILGDMNAQIGRENFNRTVAGAYTLHEITNDNGMNLCQFADANNLIIKSTCFARKKIHTGTWKAPNGALTQIDHVLISKRHSSSIIDVKTARGPNCDSDHFLVKVKFRERLARVQQADQYKKKSWNLEKLKNPLNTIQFKEVSERKILEEYRSGAGSENEGIEESWNKIRRALTDTANEVLGERVKVRGEEWFDNDCLEALRIRNQYRLSMLQRRTRQSVSDYRDSRRRAKKIIRSKKKAFLKERLKQIEELRTNNETRKFYGAVKHISRGFKPKSDTCKDKDGKIIEEKVQVMDRWAQHFSETFKINNSVGAGTVLGLNVNDDNDIEPPDIEDVMEAIEKLKNNKAAGEDSLVAEFFKNSGEAVLKQLYELILTIWEEELTPKEWGVSLICPIYKKGDKLQCENYRGISLLSVAYKIFSNVLLMKLNVYAENILKDYQCGFRRGKGTTDQIFVMRQLLEKCWEYKIDLHILFIDYRQAFDSIDRSRLIEALLELRIPHKLVRLINMTMHNNDGKVLVGGNLSKKFPISTGVRQGDAMSAVLFNLALHKAVKNLNLNGNIIHSCNQVCAYADDICLIARSVPLLKEEFKKLNDESIKIGLKINESKTKYMSTSSRRNSTKLQIEGYEFEQVDNFVYLGSELNYENKIKNEVDRRIMAANRAYFANIKLFKTSCLTRNSKIRLYKTLIRPILTYGAETWTLTSTIVNSLNAVERKFLRRIYGPVFDTDSQLWRLRRNNEIYSLYGNEDVIHFIKARRIEWLGHVERMPSDRMPSKILHNKVIGRKKRVGRPRRRWLDDVEEDLKSLGVIRWTEKARNRDAWSLIVKEAKAHPGL